MKAKKVDNFAAWRANQKKRGLIATYPPLEKNGDLAELVGIILGDGYIGEFPRSEVLRIVGDVAKPGFVKLCERLVWAVFNKKPVVKKRSNSNGVNITIYQKMISNRLGIPTGAKGQVEFTVPPWILKKREYVIRYLKGLYEAEGTFCVHAKTYTHKFIFTNKNKSLLKIVFKLLVLLGFHPHKSMYKVQLSRKRDVYEAMELLQFRKY